MARLGYGSISAKAFIAFGVDLKDGTWAPLDDAPHKLPGGGIKASALGAPLPVLWKLRLTTSIAALEGAVGSEAITEVDAAWDSAQRRLHYELLARTEDADAAMKAAAARLRGLLLIGGGSGQTALDYDAEVDFGRQQLALAKEAKAAADVALLGLEARLTEAAEATERLAAAIGRRAGQARQGAPSDLRREAVAACARAFNAVHEDLDFYLGALEKGPDRERVRELRAPLEALLARSASPAGKAPAEAGTGEEAAAQPALSEDAEAEGV